MKTRTDHYQFLKIAETALDRQKNEREYAAQRFLRRLTEGQTGGFHFLPVKKVGTSLRYPDITSSATWLGTLKHNRYPDHSPRLPADFYHACIVLQKRLQSTRLTEIPPFFKREAPKREAYLMKHLTDDGRLLVARRIVTPSFVTTAHTAIVQQKTTRCFQHHDMLPWHCARLGDGQLVLVDSGWAGWSLRYYDIAYFMLQMVGFGNRPDESQRMIRAARKAFGTQSGFADRMRAALLYRSIRLMEELAAGRRKKDALRVRRYTQQWLKTLKR